MSRSKQRQRRTPRKPLVEETVEETTSLEEVKEITEAVEEVKEITEAVEEVNEVLEEIEEVTKEVYDPTGTFTTAKVKEGYLVIGPKGEEVRLYTGDDAKENAEMYASKLANK